MADLHRKRRGCHWASSLTWDATLAANVNLHGASPWHPKQHRQLVSSNQRETPPDKPGASSSSSLRVSTAMGSVVIAQESRCVSPTRRCRARLKTAAGCPVRTLLDAPGLRGGGSRSLLSASGASGSIISLFESQCAETYPALPHSVPYFGLTSPLARK